MLEARISREGSGGVGRWAYGEGGVGGRGDGELPDPDPQCWIARPDSQRRSEGGGRAGWVGGW